MNITYPTDEEEKQINAGINADPNAQEWTDDMFKRAVRGQQIAPTKNHISLRLDRDILEWFKKDGRGYQSRINIKYAHQWLKRFDFDLDKAILEHDAQDELRRTRLRSGNYGNETYPEVK